jgi:hypothetical protein
MQINYSFLVNPKTKLNSPKLPKFLVYPPLKPIHKLGFLASLASDLEKILTLVSAINYIKLYLLIRILLKIHKNLPSTWESVQSM